MFFWKRVKEEIKRQNTTQEWVASIIPVRPDTFSRWIQRETMPNADQACSIAKALGVSVEYLVTGVPDKDIISPRIKDIHDDLLLLTDEELKSVRVLVSGLAAQHKEKEKREPSRKHA